MGILRITAHSMPGHIGRLTVFSVQVPEGRFGVAAAAASVPENAASAATAAPAHSLGSESQFFALLHPRLISLERRERRLSRSTRLDNEPRPAYGG